MNYRLRRDLRDCLENQLSGKELNSKSFQNGVNDIDKDVLQNLEKQLDLMKKV